MWKRVSLLCFCVAVVAVAAVGLDLLFYSYPCFTPRLRVREQLNSIQEVAEFYRELYGVFPDSLEELENARLGWRGGHRDPWGSDLRYQRAGQSGFELRSAGPDHELETCDDLVRHGTAPNQPMATYWQQGHEVASPAGSVTLRRLHGRIGATDTAFLVMDDHVATTLPSDNLVQTTVVRGSRGVDVVAVVHLTGSEADCTETKWLSLFRPDFTDWQTPGLVLWKEIQLQGYFECADGQVRPCGCGVWEAEWTPGRERLPVVDITHRAVFQQTSAASALRADFSVDL